MAKLLAAVLVASCAIPASAGLIQYTDAASFAAAAGSVTKYNFQGEGTGVKAAGYAVGPVSFDSASAMQVVNDGIFGSGIHYLLTRGVSISLAAGVHAISFDLGNFASARSINLVVNGTSAGSIPGVRNPASTFIGFIDTDLINSLSFSNGSELDVIRFQAGPADIPEPAMLALFGLGAIGLGLSRRRTV